MKHKFLLLYSWLIRISLFPLPDIPIFMRMRGFLYSLGMASCGKNLQVAHDANLKSLECFFLGDNVYFANQSMTLGLGKLLIGNNVMIGPCVLLVLRNHRLQEGNFALAYSQKGTIEIEDGSWIAGHCTLQRGARVPKSSVLSACSFLNRSFEQPKSIYGGVPARFIKEIEDVK